VSKSTTTPTIPEPTLRQVPVSVPDGDDYAIEYMVCPSCGRQFRGKGKSPEAQQASARRRYGRHYGRVHDGTVALAPVAKVKPAKAGPSDEDVAKALKALEAELTANLPRMLEAADAILDAEAPTGADAKRLAKQARDRAYRARKAAKAAANA